MPCVSPESLVRHEIMRDLERKEGLESTDDCHCLPACTSLEYDAQTSQADFKWENVFGVYRMNISEVEEGSVPAFGRPIQVFTAFGSELMEPALSR